MTFASLRRFVGLMALGLGLLGAEVHGQTTATTDPVLSLGIRKCAYPMCGGMYAVAAWAPGHPWEGAWPDGGFGTLVNSRTLARQTHLGITGWTVRGSIPIDFGLHHNSQATRGSPALGGKWAHSYDIRLVLDGAGTQATIQWALLEQKFTQSGGVWTAADGYRDGLAATAAGSFVLTAHGQFKFGFEATADPLVHRLKSIKDTSGNVVTLVYDASGRLTQLKDPDARSLKFSYDPAGRLTRVRYVASTFATTWSLGYDAGGRLAKIVWPTVTTEAGAQTVSVRLATDSVSGNLASVTDRAGKIWAFGHQGNGALWDQYPGNSAAQRVQYLVTPTGSRRTDPTGVTLEDEYDAMQRRVRSVDGQGHATLFAYADPQYAWAPSAVTTALGDVTTYAYDARSNPVAITPPGLGRFDLAYNSKNRLTRVLQPLVTDANGAVDASRRRTDYIYDAQSRLTKVREYTGAATYDETLQRSYSPQGLCLTETNALGQVTNYSYDAMGNLLSLTTPANRSTSWNWSDPLLTWGFRKPQALQIAGGPGTGYVYDEWGRLRERVQADASGVSYHYDAMSRLVKMVDASGTSQWSWDARGWPLAHATGGWGVGFTYDAAGRRVGVTETGAFGQASIAYTYDALGRLASQAADGVTTVYSYVADSMWPAKLEMPGVFLLRSYTGGRLTRQSHEAKGSLKFQWDYSYQANGALMRKTELDGHQTKYIYDMRDRLVREQRSGPASNHLVDYAYDAAGRRTGRTTDGVSGVFGYDADGLVQSLSAPATVYAWDAAARLTSIQNAAGLRMLVHDDAGRLTRASSPTARDDYQYDGLNRRVRHDERNPAGTLLASSALREIGDRLRRQERTVGATTTQLPVRWGPAGVESFSARFDDVLISSYTLVADDTGTRGLFDSLGQAVAFAAVYDAFGRTLEQSGATVPYRWNANAGARTEGAAGLVNLGGSAWFEPESAASLFDHPIASVEEARGCSVFSSERTCADEVWNQPLRTFLGRAPVENVITMGAGRDRGWRLSGFDPGPLDGKFGPRTEVAVWTGREMIIFGPS